MNKKMLSALLVISSFASIPAYANSLADKNSINITILQSCPKSKISPHTKNIRIDQLCIVKNKSSRPATNKDFQAYTGNTKPEIISLGHNAYAVETHY